MLLAIIIVKTVPITCKTINYTICIIHETTKDLRREDLKGDERRVRVE